MIPATHRIYPNTQKRWAWDVFWSVIFAKGFPNKSPAPEGISLHEFNGAGDERRGGSVDIAHQFLNCCPGNRQEV